MVVERFNVLFDNTRYIIIQNQNTGLISFGSSECFESFYGFPVNQSCLTAEEAIEELDRWKEIDRTPNFKQYHDLYKKQYGITPIEQWDQMISAIRAACC